jgi:excisionase family DNA binding protein
MTLWEIANADKLGQQVSVARAAKHCDCTQKHIYRMIKRGDLKAHKFGGKVLIPLQSLMEALKPIAHYREDDYLMLSNEGEPQDQLREREE